MATRKPVAARLERWKHNLFPLVLIVLGIVIFVEGGAFGLWGRSNGRTRHVRTGAAGVELGSLVPRT